MTHRLRTSAVRLNLRDARCVDLEIDSEVRGLGLVFRVGCSGLLLGVTGVPMSLLLLCIKRMIW